MAFAIQGYLNIFFAAATPTWGTYMVCESTFHPCAVLFRRSPVLSSASGFDKNRPIATPFSRVNGAVNFMGNHNIGMVSGILAAFDSRLACQDKGIPSWRIPALVIDKLVHLFAGVRALTQKVQGNVLLDNPFSGFTVVAVFRAGNAGRQEKNRNQKNRFNR